MPLILGPALDGRAGFARVPDPSSPDGWAHAQGPMQFLPSTGGPGDGLRRTAPAGAVPSAAQRVGCHLERRRTGLRNRRTDRRPPSIDPHLQPQQPLRRPDLAKAAEYDAAARAATATVDSGGMTCPVAAPVRHSNDWHAAPGGRLHQWQRRVRALRLDLVAIEAGVIDRSSDTESGLGGITVWLRGDRALAGTTHNARNLVARGARCDRWATDRTARQHRQRSRHSPHVHFEMHPAGGAAANSLPADRAAVPASYMTWIAHGALDPGGNPEPTLGR
ncbi:MAG: hypothetical protein M5T61_18740 [Acidimicrobiia bacterium]|nr:hypothetical protein [Acidimicrobiia bacterium]